ncbi:toprim domain-containing protein [Falsiroseomonas sp.]|uniref:DUF7146 domain-containing protein n=1 Tax=Falsiroseomonas sp. TaxID=2870721 RepID=UPI0027256E12|nr:toprim domain-containing protein [Falsiroseomonas sp.]MDO9500270.1 toprim domain-containing protein [Falsiroseomonas sp.]
MRPNIDCATVARLLAERIGALAPELLPDGARRGGEWVARCPWRADRTPGSFMLAMDGQHRGHWRDWATGERGDALDLLAQARGLSMAEALRWALGWLGEGGDRSARPVPHRPVAPPVAPAAAMPSATRDLARTIWREAVAPAGTLVAAYLASRGLSRPDDAPIRFHPECPRGAERWPAMVALMTDPATNQPVGVHRTFLARDGSGKAPGPMPAKMMAGNAGVIRLTPDYDVVYGLGLAEGIETSLAVIQQFGWRPIWAATSAGGIAGFPVLAGIDALTIFADPDAAGLAAADACAARWKDAGREAEVFSPPDGDFNDLATEGRQ